MNESQTSKVVAWRYGVLTVEQSDALHAVSAGNAYRGAESGNCRAGRSRSLRAIQRRGLIDCGGPVGNCYRLTDEGRNLLSQRRAVYG
jgi:hypothetical protein